MSIPAENRVCAGGICCERKNVGLSRKETAPKGKGKKGCHPAFADETLSS